MKTSHRADRRLGLAVANVDCDLDQRGRMQEASLHQWQKLRPVHAMAERDGPTPSVHAQRGGWLSSLRHRSLNLRS
jgi:hypothetical protein